MKLLTVPYVIGSMQPMKKKSQSWTAKDLAKMYVEKTSERPTCVGIEWERSGVYRDTMQPVRYTGTQGYLAVLQKLVAEAGWQIVEEEEGCGIIVIRRGEANVTIEGDGRPELAGSPQPNLHDLAREFRLHNNEYEEMGNVFNIGWLPTGFQPLHASEEIELAPRKRYGIFQHLGDAKLMADMTKRTNGLTANLSYMDDVSAVRMAQTAFRVLPVVAAMYASSPLDKGVASKYLDLRRACIQAHFPERTEVPKYILEDDFTLVEWVKYYMRLPVILRKRNGVTESLLDRKLTFEQWMEKGIDGDFPSMDDFDQHVKTTWSDIRLRPSYIEYRPADSARGKFVMTLPALMKGLLHDEKNWDKIKELTADWTYDDIIAADQKAWKNGLKTKINGKSLLEVAQQMLILATESLHSFKNIDATGEDESVFLAPLKQRVFIDEESPAEEILRRWETDWQRNPKSLLEWCEEK
jgi:glutamate--cysteine ligase